MHILQAPHEDLRTVCAPVTEFGHEVRELARRMLVACRAHEGAGLAANQLGECVRVIVVDYQGELAMVNPVIKRRSRTQQRVDDGCLSVERGTLRGITARASEVFVEWQDFAGAAKRGVFKGLRAAIVQHEVDHLDGKLFTDLISRAA